MREKDKMVGQSVAFVELIRAGDTARAAHTVKKTVPLFEGLKEKLNLLQEQGDIGGLNEQEVLLGKLEVDMEVQMERVMVQLDMSNGFGTKKRRHACTHSHPA